MYGENWDKYYQRTYREMKKKALWDVPPDEAVGLDLPVFKSQFLAGLPLIDLGCGTGTQTAHLAQHFEQVLGVDVAAEAISVARENFPDPKNFSFGVLDVTDVEGAKKVRLQLDNQDANIYMRGVLHQIKEEDLGKFHEVLSILIGKTGQLYCVEVSDRIREYFEQSADDFSKLPRHMQRVFISNLPPKGVSLENLTTFFPEDRFSIRSSSAAALKTNLKFKAQQAIEIPAVAALVVSR